MSVTPFGVTGFVGDTNCISDSAIMDSSCLYFQVVLLISLIVIYMQIVSDYLSSQYLIFPILYTALVS